MIVTKLHLTYWRSKHVPRWAAKIEVKRHGKSYFETVVAAEEAGPSVHELINAQDTTTYPRNPKAKRPDHNLHNTMSLLRLVRHNISTRAEKRDMVSYLQYLLDSRDPVRRVWAARFLRKIKPSAICPLCGGTGEIKTKPLDGFAYRSWSRWESTPCTCRRRS